MRSIMLAGAAMLAFTTGAVAIAQDATGTTSQPPEAGASPAGSSATPADPATPANPATPSSSPDPNAAQPTGAVPPTTGMAPAPAGVPQDPAAPVGSSANPVTVGGNMTPPPAGRQDYPVCSRTVQDSCINPGEARKARKRR